MSLLFLVGAVAAGFCNCLFRISWLYAVTALCAILWFFSRPSDAPAPGEKFVTLCGLGLTISAVWECVEHHSGEGEAAFLAVTVLITYLLARTQRS